MQKHHECQGLIVSNEGVASLQLEPLKPIEDNQLEPRHCWWQQSNQDPNYLKISELYGDFLQCFQGHLQQPQGALGQPALFNDRKYFQVCWCCRLKSIGEFLLVSPRSSTHMSLISAVCACGLDVVGDAFSWRMGESTTAQALCLSADGYQDQLKSLR